MRRHDWQFVVILLVVLVLYPVLDSRSHGAANEVRKANISVCQRVTQPNLQITNRKANANARGWTEAWKSRRELARVTTGKEHRINVAAAREYHGIVLTLGEPLKNPPCAVRYPKP